MKKSVAVLIIFITTLLISGIGFAAGEPLSTTSPQQGSSTPVGPTNAERRYADWIAEEVSAMSTDTADIQRVFISASDGETPALVVIGSGPDATAAIRDALDRLGRLWPGNQSPQWLKLDIVQNSRVLENVDLTQPVTFERSLHGIALNWEAGLAFLPEEIVAHTLIDSEGDWHFDNMVEYLPQRPALMTALEPFTSTAAGNIVVFETSSIFIDDDQVLKLYRGHRTDISLASNDLVNAAIAGSDYLAAAVDAEGKFTYSYLPKSDRIQDDYNILRHAGTIYAMLEVYEVSRDPVLFNAITRAIGYLVGSMVPCPGQTSDGLFLCVVEDDFVKLGGNGLAIVALSEFTALTGDERYLALMDDLAGWIRDAQRDDGSFVHKVHVPTNETDVFKSLYYPGEAILAMTRLHAIDGNEQWLDVAVKATNYLINVRDEGLSTEDLIHDHWLLYGINDLYRFRPDDIHFEHAMRIAQAIVMSQNLNPEYQDWWGSYYRPPRSTPTATRSEGLCSAYQLARDYGTPEQAERIYKTLQHGLTFQLKTQFQPESAMYLDDPQRVMGAFHHSLTNYEVRIDYVQHNISALLCAAEVAKD